MAGSRDISMGYHGDEKSTKKQSYFLFYPTLFQLILFNDFYSWEIELSIFRKNQGSFFPAVSISDYFQRKRY